MGIQERKEREKLKRRNDILEAAEQVFFSKGVVQATMDDIAEQAELSKGTLYLYFNSKEELLYAIKIKASRILKNSFQEAFDPAKTGLEMVEDAGRRFIRYSEQYPDYYQLMLHFEGKSLENLDMENPFIKQFFEEEDPMQAFVEIVKKGIGDGSLRQDIQAEILAYNLWAMTTGVMQMIANQQHLLSHCGLEGKDGQFREALFALLRQGIAKNNGNES